ncbi:hypothetical protein HPB49_006895 [Dermacentor silvarum]|uniref:Uncharacterized protein n=1 Tax=Dermacentor silvarum TaxID=543639 RepID=A0ACB8DWB2_DERSI|nr:hypothetical protein HPB49_006895 [Dermacentor silvarum]
MENKPEPALEKAAPSTGRSSMPLLSLPCSRSEENPICMLVGRLGSYNEALWYAGLELKEENGKGLGELTLGVAADSQHELSWKSAAIERETIAVSLLASLLSLHRCIVAIDLNHFIAKRPFLLNWLQYGRGVRSLKIQASPHFDETVIKAVVNVLNPVDQHMTPLFEQYHTYSVRRPTLVVPPRQNGRATLTTLDVAALDMNGPRAKQFITMLRDNRTITELVVGSCAFTYGCIDLAAGFRKYLMREDSVLKKLTIRTADVSKQALQSLVNAVAVMTSLEELVADIDLYNVQDKVVFAEIVARNKTLRALSIIWPRSCLATSILHNLEHPVLNPAKRIEPWVIALTGNTSLSSLTIDLLGFTEYECYAFFLALECNTSLRRVTVMHLPAREQLEEICHMIRHSHMAEKVIIKDISVTYDNLDLLPECPEVTSVTVSSVQLIGRDHFYRAFTDVLVACHTLKKLHVCVHSYLFDHDLETAMATYVTGATALRNFELHVYVNTHEREMEDVYVSEAPESPLAKALSLHPSLVKISVRELRLNERDSRSLAEASLGSTSITQVTFAALGTIGNKAFLRFVMPRIERNYRLLRLSLPACEGRDSELAFIRNITRRNSSLVTRAARFVMGEQDAYCARAIELVSGHAALVDMVCERAAVEAGEAAAMIRRALGLPCLTSLSGFMKLAGVVKHRVECVAGRGRTLDQLHEDCWLHIRKYLKVVDIVHRKR